MILVHETIEAEERKRQIQSEQVVKRQKVTMKDKQAENKENKGDNGPKDDEDAPVPIPETQVKKLKALVDNAQSKLAAASASFVEAAAEENKEYVPSAVVAKMEKSIEHLKSAIETGTGWLAENRVGKNAFKSFFPSCKGHLDVIKGLEATISQRLEVKAS